MTLEQALFELAAAAERLEAAHDSGSDYEGQIMGIFGALWMVRTSAGFDSWNPYSPPAGMPRSGAAAVEALPEAEPQPCPETSYPVGNELTSSSSPPAGAGNPGS